MPAEVVHDVNELTLWRTALRQERHSLPPNFTTLPNPAVSEDVVVCCLARPGAVYAVRRETGSLLWRVALDRYGAAHARIVNGLVFAASTHTLYALDLHSGNIMWRFSPHSEAGAWLCGGPVPYEKVVVIGDETGFVHCLNQRTGNVLWKRPASGASNPPAIITGTVIDDYFVSATNGREAFALDIDSGDEVWRQGIDSVPIGDVQTLDRHALITTVQSLYFFDSDNGNIDDTWRWADTDLGGALAAHDALYVLTTKAWASKGPDIDEKAPVDGILTAYAGQAQRFEIRYAAPHLSLIAGPDPAYLYDCSPRDLKIRDSHTGEIVHTITSSPGSAVVAGLVSVCDGTIYMLNGPEAAIYALRHP